MNGHIYRISSNKRRDVRSALRYGAYSRAAFIFLTAPRENTFAPHPHI